MLIKILPMHSEISVLSCILRGKLLLEAGPSAGQTPFVGFQNCQTVGPVEHLGRRGMVVLVSQY